MNFCAIVFVLLFMAPNLSFISTNRLSIRLPILLSKTSNNVNQIGWMCDFSVDDCGITNQYNMGSKFKLVQNDKKTTLGKNNLYLLEITNTRSSLGARLETPYFPANNQTDGCLGFEYLITGSGQKKLVLTQQNERLNRCLWQTVNDRISDDWKTVTVNIDFRGGEPKFFVDAVFDEKRVNRGLIAISKFWFSYGKCEKNDAISCR